MDRDGHGSARIAPVYRLDSQSIFSLLRRRVFTARYETRMDGPTPQWVNPVVGGAVSQARRPA